MILFLAANPQDTGRLALDQEARSIHVELKRSGFRDRFDFVTRWAAEPLDLLRELRELRPTVVHFSGHGARPAAATEPAQTAEPAPMGDEVQTAEPAPSRDVVALGPRPAGGSGGLVVNGTNGDSQVISPEPIAQTLDAVGSRVRLVVLNACYSAPIADALLVQVDCVVGMSGAIHDDAARSFAIGFYGGLREHESIAAAFKQGVAAIKLDGRPDAERPQLHVRAGFDASQLILAAVAPSVWQDVPCPYPGMRPFTADDAAGFHGRDAECDELIGRLRAGERGKTGTKLVAEPDPRRTLHAGRRTARRCARGGLRGLGTGDQGARVHVESHQTLVPGTRAAAAHRLPTAVRHRRRARGALLRAPWLSRRVPLWCAAVSTA